MTYYESSVEDALRMLREAQRAGRRVRCWARGRTVTAAVEGRVIDWGEYTRTGEWRPVTLYGRGSTLAEALFNLSHHEAF